MGLGEGRLPVSRSHHRENYANRRPRDDCNCSDCPLRRVVAGASATGDEGPTHRLRLAVWPGPIGALTPMPSASAWPSWARSRARPSSPNISTRGAAAPSSTRSWKVWSATRWTSSSRCARPKRCRRRNTRRTIPIVVAATGDPVKAGLVQIHVAPGGQRHRRFGDEPAAFRQARRPAQAGLPEIDADHRAVESVAPGQYTGGEDDAGGRSARWPQVPVGRSRDRATSSPSSSTPSAGTGRSRCSTPAIRFSRPRRA